MNFFQPLQDLGYNTAIGIMNTLPDADPDVVEKISNAVAGFKTAMLAVDWFFPTHDLMIVISIIASVEVTIFLFHTTRWILAMMTFGVVK